MDEAVHQTKAAGANAQPQPVGDPLLGCLLQLCKWFQRLRSSAVLTAGYLKANINQYYGMEQLESRKAYKIPGISVIMPVYNGSEFLEKSLSPLISMLKREEILEVIVIDDGSIDNSADLAKRLGAKVMSTGGRKGPGAGRNIATRKALGSVLWFVDADVVVHDDAARIVSKGFENKEVVAIFGSYDNSPPAENFLSQYKNLIHHYYHQKANKEASTFWAGCGGVRRQSFLNIGGFNIEKFKHPSIEDIELGYRLRAAGGRINLLADLQSTHLKVWRIGNLLHTEFFRRALPWSRLMIEQSGLINDLNVGIGERIRAALAGILLLAFLAGALNLLSWWIPLTVLLITVTANSKLACFFYKRKGLLFTIHGLLYQQFYYIYSSVAYAWAFFELKIVA